MGEQRFTAAEMKVGLPEVSRVFNETRDELGNVTRTPNGYDGDLNIVVNTKKLDKIQAAQRAILNFRAQNEFIPLRQSAIFAGQFGNHQTRFDYAGD